MSWKRRSGRIKPLLDLKCNWHPGSTYPDTIQVAMRDGRVVTYSLQVKPERIYVGDDRLPMRNEVVGYQYKKSPLKKMTSFLQRGSLPY